MRYLYEVIESLNVEKAVEAALESNYDFEEYHYDLQTLEEVVGYLKKAAMIAKDAGGIADVIFAEDCIDMDGEPFKTVSLMSFEDNEVYGLDGMHWDEICQCKLDNSCSIPDLIWEVTFYGIQKYQ